MRLENRCMLLEEEMQKSLKSVHVDEEKIFCPYRVKKVNGVKKVVYSDHCTIVAELEIDIGKVQSETKKESGWNFNSDGCEIYSMESEITLEFDLSALNSTLHMGETVFFLYCVVSPPLRNPKSKF